MTPPFLPPELYIQIIDHVGTPPPAQDRAFKLPQNIAQDLLSLSLVSRDFHVWTSSTLYRRISLRPCQLFRLRTTLWPRSERTMALARWIRSLHIRWREDEPIVGVGGRTTPTLTSGGPIAPIPSASLRDIALVLHVTSTTLQRLFLDVDVADQDLNRMLMFHQPFTLNIAISSMTALSEFIFGHSSKTMVYLTLPSRAPIRRLALIGENVQKGFVERIAAFKDLEQLALFSPWVRTGSSLPDAGAQFARLFSPPTSAKRLVMMTTTQHQKVATLSSTALIKGMMDDPHMKKATDTVTVTCPKEPVSWNAISEELIATGNLQEIGWETFGGKRLSRED